MPRKMMYAMAVAAACALVAVATAFAASGKTTHKKATTKHSTASGEAGGWPGPPGGGPGGMGPGHGGVHSESVVPNKEGTAFITVTTDSGKVQSVDASAGTLTIVEGTKTLTYKTVTLTIPSGATIMLDGKSSSLSAIAAEDHVTVSSSSEGTTVFAVDSSFQPPAMHQGAPPAGGGPPAGF
jgi:hypothetical protein